MTGLHHRREYVEPSATELIKPGQRVSHLFPRAVMEEYVLQRVTERVWWVTRQFYGSLFYVGKRGVLLFELLAAPDHAMFLIEEERVGHTANVVNEAVPKIIERLRPKYGRMYDFDDAQPFNVRLMAMDMQVTMSNR